MRRLPAHLIGHIVELSMPGTAKFVSRDVRASIAIPFKLRNISRVSQLRWAIAHGFQVNAHRIIVAGLFKLLRLCHRLGLCPLTEKITNWAAINDRLDILRWAVKKGCPMSHVFFVLATGYRHPRIVKWAYRRGMRPSHFDTSHFHASYDVGLQRWMVKHGFPVR